MNPQGFSFPPPPPPPPPTQQHQPQQQYPHNAAYNQYGQNHYGQRGGRGSGHFRGRGRGHNGRGGGRGGHYTPSDATHSGAYTPATAGYGPMNYLGYPTQLTPNQHTSAQAPHYPQPSSQNYQSQMNSSAFASPTHYTQPPVHGTSYQQPPGYNAYSTPSMQQTSYARAPASGQPTMMGPPIHWGLENTGHPGSFHASQRSNQRGPRQSNVHNNQPSSQGKHVNKRDHSSAFGKPQSTAPRVPAPPPVPSFGNPLPSKPPAPADSPRKPKKKKRKHNQLGLTPKTEEHESSEEEDDADEETRLAAGGAAVGTGLQVTYRGRTSNLQTTAEIAAWIAERKKRFPTQAKIEEKKKVMEEAKKAKEEAQRQREARKQAAAREKKEQDKHRPNQPTRAALDPADAAAKAKRKAEKLRRKLEKEEKRIAQAEADAERARKLEKSQTGSLDATIEGSPTTKEGEQGTALGTSQDMQSLHVGSEPSVVPTSTKVESLMYDEATAGNSASDTSDSSDWTSSSGSDTSSDSDDSDDDSAPEQATSRREGPERVPPPPREGPKRVCRHFARTGRCIHGKNCKFLHEKPERGGNTKPVENKGRKGLLEALLDRQKEDENRKVMETIVWLGENGLLDEPAAQLDAAVGSTEPKTTSSGA
ncbi:hypothetical protein BJX63DRAFT_191343 [Aspergillus granulosus]|uniref:C3H1-type domain-containing protein n=1 Tax=Aspergillus granulosus TaxID=176169 RepID=A0ABR4HH31_9EURO